MSKLMKIILLLAVFVFVISSAWNVSTRIDTQKQTNATLDNVIDASVLACKEDEKFRAQYRIRGEDVVILAEVDKLQTLGAIGLLSESESKKEFQVLLPKVQKIINNIEILPVPNCELRRKRLEKDLPAG